MGGVRKFELWFLEMNSNCSSKLNRNKHAMESCGGLREAPYDTPEFIRVFVPFASSHQMSIPAAFIKNFKTVIPNKVIIFDHSKKPWHVELEQTNDHLFFSNGWQGFATYHLLECGDFLLFRYLKNSRFEAKVFNKDGCKKEVAVDRTISHGQNSEAEEYRRRQEKTVQGSRQPSPQEDPHQIPPAEILEEEEIELETAHPQASPAREKRHLGIGSKKNEEASCLSKVARRRKSQDPKQNKMPKDSHFVAPTNPYFVLAISNYSKYFLNVPQSVLRPSNMKLMPKVVVHNQNGNTWPVKINFLKNGKTNFGTGWPDFINGNNVEVGDQCVFEFVPRRENICDEVHVQILRQNTRVEKPS